MIALLRWLFSTLGMKVVATGQTATATRGAAPRQELCVCGQLAACVCGAGKEWGAGRGVACSRSLD